MKITSFLLPPLDFLLPPLEKFLLIWNFINGGAYLLLYVMLCSRYEKFILRKYH